MNNGKLNIYWQRYLNKLKSTLDMVKIINDKDMLFALKRAYKKCAISICENIVLWFQEIQLINKCSIVSINHMCFVFHNVYQNNRTELLYYISICRFY